MLVGGADTAVVIVGRLRYQMFFISGRHEGRYARAQARYHAKHYRYDGRSLARAGVMARYALICNRLRLLSRWSGRSEPMSAMIGG